MAREKWQDRLADRTFEEFKLEEPKQEERGALEEATSQLDEKNWNEFQKFEPFQEMQDD